MGRESFITFEELSFDGNAETIARWIILQGLPFTRGNVDDFYEYFIGEYSTIGEWFEEWNDGVLPDGMTDWDEAAYAAEDDGLYRFERTYYRSVCVFKTDKLLEIEAEQGDKMAATTR